MNWSLKTAPTLDVVELDTLKRQCRIELDQADEEELLRAYLKAAQAWVEDYAGRALLTQTWQVSLPDFPDRLWLPRAAPLQSVTFVKYYDASNVLQTLSSSSYVVPAFAEPACVVLADTYSWPDVYDRPDAVRVEYVCGWDDPADVPANLVQAVLLLVGHYYEHREHSITGVMQAPIAMAAEALCAPSRVFLRMPEWPRL